MLCKCVHTAHMSPTLNEVLRYSGKVIEIHKGVMFDFYLGLPHMFVYSCGADRWWPRLGTPESWVLCESACVQIDWCQHNMRTNIFSLLVLYTVFCDSDAWLNFSPVKKIVIQHFNYTLAIFIFHCWVGYKTWTLDYGLHYGLDFRLDWTANLVCLKMTLNAGLSNG